MSLAAAQVEAEATLDRRQHPEERGRVHEVAVHVVSGAGQLDPRGRVRLPDLAGIGSFHRSILARTQEFAPGATLLPVDDNGFAEWYREQYRRVFASVLLVSGDHAAVADAVDEAFARALERWARVSAMDSPIGWTFTVARNQLRRSARRRARERELAPAPAVAAEVDVALWATVRSLPNRERELVALRYIAGLTESQIASTLGIAPGTVARGLHDARAHLHSMLTPEEDPA